MERVSGRKLSSPEEIRAELEELKDNPSIDRSDDEEDIDWNIDDEGDSSSDIGDDLFTTEVQLESAIEINEPSTPHSISLKRASEVDRSARTQCPPYKANVVKSLASSLLILADSKERRTKMAKHSFGEQILSSTLVKQLQKCCSHAWTSVAIDAIEPVQSFYLFITDRMLQDVMRYTNEAMAICKSSIGDLEYIDELKALHGLFDYSAAKKDSLLLTSMLFSGSYCSDHYPTTMSKQ